MVMNAYDREMQSAIGAVEDKFRSKRAVIDREMENIVAALKNIKHFQKNNYTFEDMIQAHESMLEELQKRRAELTKAQEATVKLLRG